MNGLLSALLIIPILGILIFLHELGHFVMARRAGVRVDEFGFGLPPRIWGTKRGDTLYSINLLPIGGFVRVHGEDGKADDPESVNSKTPGQRARFLFAGPAMNFIAAFVIVVAIVAFQGRTTEQVFIDQVVSGSPADAAGWESGDRVVAAGGSSIDSVDELMKRTGDYLDGEMPVTVERGGELLQTTVVPRSNPPAGEGRTGVVLNGASLANIEVQDVPPSSAAAAVGFQKGDDILRVDGVAVNNYYTYATAIRRSVGQEVAVEVKRDGAVMPLTFVVPGELATDREPLGMDLVQQLQFESIPLTAVPGESVRLFFSTIGRMFEGLASLVRGDTPLDELAGPIGMGQLTSEVIAESATPIWVTILNLMFLLSLNLGLLNLLPIPALDGGRLMFVLIEVLRGGRKISPEKEGMVHFLGMVLLLSTMLIIAFLDIDRLISGNSFLD